MGNRTHGRDRLHPRDACGWRAGREVEGLLRVGVPTLGRLGSLEGGLARAKRVVVIVVAVVVIRRAGSAVQMNVGASAASVVVDEDRRPRPGDGGDAGGRRGRGG